MKAIKRVLLGVALATLLVLMVFLAVALFSTSTTDVTVRLVNDTRSRVTVRGCDDSDCATIWTQADLDPGLSAERDVPVDDIVEYFEVKQSGRTLECLPLRVHDAYERSGDSSVADLIPGLHRRPELKATAQQVFLITLGIASIWLIGELAHSLA